MCTQGAICKNWPGRVRLLWGMGAVPLSGVQWQSSWSGGSGGIAPEADDISIIKAPYFAFNCVDESVFFLESELVL